MCQQWQISLIHVVRVLFRSTTNRPHVASQHAQQIHHVSPFPLRFSSISISLSFSHTYPPIHQVVDDSQYSSSDTLRAHHQQRGCFSAIPPLHERALSLMDDLSIGSRRLEGHALFFSFLLFNLCSHTQQPSSHVLSKQNGEKLKIHYCALKIYEYLCAVCKL